MNAPIVDTGAGKVRGVWRAESAAFLGIPFAAPPVGDNRFASPQPHPTWSGVRDATQYGATPQRRPFGPVVTIPEPSIPGESTLNVNVFTPAPGDRDAGLPVLVWIHGGGFFAGSPASPWYDGAAFNGDGVVTVSISYRLGFDGFGWIDDAPSNRGILDQIAALQWVQDNIEAFGGDPAKVTIAGQSAGGGSVLTLLTIPRAQGLFRAAISQSGMVRNRSLEMARENGQRFAEKMGTDPTRSGWGSLSEDQILDGQLELTAVADTEGPPEQGIVGWARGVVSGDIGGSLAFIPHVDDELLVGDNLDMVGAGTGADKPLLVGTTAHEFTMATMPLRKPLAEHDPVALLAAAGLNPDSVAAMLGSFPEFDPALLLGQVLTEFMFRVPLLDVVDARQAAAGPSGTWLYDFQSVSPVLGLATHCNEVPYVWDLLNAENVTNVLGDHPLDDLADAMHGAWVGFVRDGEPGWSPCTNETRPGMVFADVSRQEADLYQLEAELRRANA